MLALTALPCTALHAQWLGGVGQDARVVPRGTMRVTVEGRLEHFDQRYDAEGNRIPAAGALADADLDAAAVPALAPLQALTAPLGVGDVPLSLGRLTVRADVSRAAIPVRFDLGVGARLQLTATVPYVQTHVAVSSRLNPDASEGNLGLNPAIGGGDAAAANDQLAAQLRAAAAALRTQADGCAAGGSAPACADPAAARQLATSAEEYASSLLAVYGGQEVIGSGLVPVQSSAAGQAVLARLSAMREQLVAYGVTGVDAAARPAGATAPLTLTELQAVLASPELGYLPIRNVSRYGIGDMELGARIAIRELGPTPPDAPPPTLAWRAAVGALVRLGTGRPDDPASLLDVGVGDGQTDLEVQAVTDLFTGRFATSLGARYGVQLADQREMRVPSAAGAVLPDAASLMLVDRDLGDYLELELTPRFALNRFIALAGHYRIRDKGADSYSAADGSGALPLLSAGSEGREQVVGGGIVLSTLAAYAMGEMRTPLEVWYRHTATIAGRGTQAVRAQRDEVALRVYLDLFGRGAGH
ncbi:MAG TPA: hypothetical protein VF048_13325 [Gemmatimonadaceae bacterium]